MSIRIDDDNYPTPAEIRGQAQRAKERGLVVTIERRGARVDHTVFDPRDGSTNLVTGVSCNCVQFIRGGGCCHHWALLLAELDWIPPDALVDARLAARV